MKRRQKGKSRYEILVEDTVRWQGNNPQKELLTLTQKYPRSKISIRWRPGKEILIAFQDRFIATFRKGKQLEFVF